MTSDSGSLGFGIGGSSSGIGRGRAGSSRDMLDRCQCYSCRRMRKAIAAMGVAPRHGGAG